MEDDDHDHPSSGNIEGHCSAMSTSMTTAPCTASVVAGGAWGWEGVVDGTAGVGRAVVGSADAHANRRCVVEDHTAVAVEEELTNKGVLGTNKVAAAEAKDAEQRESSSREGCGSPVPLAASSEHGGVKRKEIEERKRDADMWVSHDESTSWTSQ
uniref:DUF834 domain-containing protein n=1 Tax=Oryza punctata TaxID=4537 RepID=A0A0E0L258_ORYPU